MSRWFFIDKIPWKYIILIIVIFLISCNYLSDCDRKKPVKRNNTPPIWQKIMITTIKGQVFKLINPAIDYTNKESSSSEDIESFGIRTDQGDETTTLLWDDISHIECVLTDKSLIHAKIAMNDGTVIEENLVSDAKGGLSGKLNGEEFRIKLNEVKTIDVLRN